VRFRRERQAEVRRILVGTNRSETAGRAVRWAVEMAERYDAELLVLQVGRDETEAAGLDDFAAEVGGERSRGVFRVDEDPARAIVDVAREEGVDVIVVGSVGMAGRKQFLLENVPNRISHNAPCTVVIVQTSEAGRR
jgi:ubiquinone biosynthesis protein